MICHSHLHLNDVITHSNMFSVVYKLHKTVLEDDLPFLANLGDSVSRSLKSDGEPSVL